MEKTSTDITYDAFLLGKVQAWQHARGFRSGLEAIFLAAALPQQLAGSKACHSSLLEAGCNTGVALLCAAFHMTQQNRTMHLTGIDIHEQSILLAKKNLAQTSLPFTLEHRNFLEDMTITKAFDLVISNPPFFLKENHKGSPHTEKDRANFISRDDFCLWIKRCCLLTKAKGFAIFIVASDLFSLFHKAAAPYANRIDILPLFTGPKKPATRLLLRVHRGEKNKIFFHNGLEVSGTLGQKILEEGALISSVVPSWACSNM